MDFAAKLPAKARALLQRREQQKHSAFLEELSDLQLQLNAARSQFDILTDEDMIDACCYQIKALATRYDRMLREAKCRGLQSAPYGVDSALHRE